MENSNTKKIVSIIGGGPAALLLAAFLDENKFDVTIYEKNKAVGRKFLVAGKGGFNLTHSEDISKFIKRYTPHAFLKESLEAFSNADLIAWLKTIGVPTFVGSSKRVYPAKGIRPIEVLNKIMDVLAAKNVKIETGLSWTGWNEKGHPVFNVKRVVPSDFSVFSLGGGSWKVTGSDGKWTNRFAKKGINIIPFQPANCGYHIHWPKEFLSTSEGHPLKNISIRCHRKTQKGELVITKLGLEGGAIYALSPEIQVALEKENKAKVYIDLKPTLSHDALLDKILAKRKNMSDVLRKDLNLSSAQVHLIKAFISKEDFLESEILAKKIKELELEVVNAAPIDEAISTTGGIDRAEITSNFELKKMKNTYCIGEMLDWNAPTGGYLLQACFSMGVKVARHLNN